MIQIGRYKFGFVPLSMIAVFIVLTACAVVASITQDNPYSPLPLSARILINDGMALLATLVYGIFAHFAIVIITQLKK
jgi:hypothetical protein